MCAHAAPYHPTPHQTCGGKVLRCLTDKADDIGDEGCRKEVYYFEKVGGRGAALALAGGGGQPKELFAEAGLLCAVTYLGVGACAAQGMHANHK